LPSPAAELADHVVLPTIFYFRPSTSGGSVVGQQQLAKLMGGSHVSIPPPKDDMLLFDYFEKSYC
jgi:hypothetical protein